MSDKPKKFHDWLSRKLEIAPSAKDWENLHSMKDIIELGWNERSKSVDNEISEAVENTRKEMQAEIDKRDNLLHVLLNRGVVYTMTNGKMEYVLSEELYQVCKCQFKELNQGSKDE